MTDRLTANLPSKDGPGTFAHHKAQQAMNPADLREKLERARTLARSLENAGGSKLMTIYDRAGVAADLHALLDALAAKDARIAELEGALKFLLHAVSGETGFAAAVRNDSGLAYPWPALDIAEEQARLALTAKEG